MSKEKMSLERIAAIKQLAPEEFCICKYTMDENGNVYHNGRCRYSGPTLPGTDIPKNEIPYEYKE